MVGFSSYAHRIALMGVLLLSAQSIAGEFDNKCRQAGDSAKNACKGAVDAAKAGDNSQSGAIAAGSGNAVNPNAGNLGQGISGQQGRLSQAQSACEAAKQKCTSACDQAQQKAQSTPDPQTQKPPHSDAQKIPGTKQSSCIAPIQAMLGELGKAQDNLGKDKQASEDTKNASQGGGAPPGGGKSGGGDDKKDQGQNQNPNAQLAGGINCNTSDGTRYSDCNEKLIEKCKSSMSDTICEAFGTRYCGSVSSGQSPSLNAGGILRPTFSSNNTTGMVVDKSGEGLGSSYCKTYTAYKFCQQTGRGACPSCVNLQASNSPTCISSPEQCMGQNSPDVLDRARKDCPSDPLFSDPSTQRSIATTGTTARDPSSTSGSLNGSKNGTSGSGGAVGMGGHGSGSTATDGSGTSAGSDVEYGQAPGRPHSNAGVSEGGGGGGYSPESSSSEIDPFKIQSGDGKGGRPHVGGASVNGSIPADVAKEFGPSLFSISTSTYQSLCQKQRLNCRN